MKKKILTILLFILSFSIYSQEYEIIEEVVTDSNNKVISKNEFKKYTFKTPEDLLDFFYKNQTKIETLNSIISYRMYQATPYDKFKDILNAKISICGELTEKHIIKKEFSDDKLSVMFDLKVKYNKLNTLEKVILIRESLEADFKVYQYNIKEDI